MQSILTFLNKVVRMRPAVLKAAAAIFTLLTFLLFILLILGKVRPLFFWVSMAFLAIFAYVLLPYFSKKRRRF